MKPLDWNTFISMVTELHLAFGDSVTNISMVQLRPFSEKLSERKLNLEADLRRVVLVQEYIADLLTNETAAKSYEPRKAVHSIISMPWAMGAKL